MDKLSTLDNAWMLLDGTKIEAIGEMATMPGGSYEVYDSAQRMILPTWVDSHTHLVFAKSREQEFVDRIHGLTYQEIALKGGGILNSVRHTNAMSEEELLSKALERLNEVIHLGTGAIEIKSGYGLSVDGELKLLRVIQKLKSISPIPIKATFLGAHAIPENFKNDKKGYLNLIIDEMLPQIAKEKLADFCDIFCERGYFDYDDTMELLAASRQYGILGKVHAEQLSSSNGIKAGVESRATSVDHLEYADESDFECLKDTHTIPNILPGAAFFLGLPHPPARQMIDFGLPLSLATDYNPGSSPCGNMHLMLSIACVQYKITPSEAIHAATINSAYAMASENLVGSLSAGKLANFIILKDIPSIDYIPYAFGSNIIESVWINGKPFKNNIL